MKRTAQLGLMLVGAAMLASGAGGCYRKVVGAQGFGADRVSIEKGNAPPSDGKRTLGYPTVTPKKLPGE